VAVDVRTEGKAFQVGTPRVLFEVDLDPRAVVRNRYVASPDGERFLMLVPDGQAGPAPLTVILNWR
jgi:hypothetical protein